ncbi:MAG TPA: hypothetical protein VM735_08945 [Candidatus Kapabacteria bacterium]|nr:hypothetical protein [Candidatus Kapabacteria bacterium]
MPNRFSVNQKISIALFAALGFLAGCSPESATAKADRRKEVKGASHATVGNWNWESYPPTKRMRVAQLPCQLQPKSTITVQSPIAGLLRIYAPSPQADLPSGFLWGEFEPEILKQDEIVLQDSLKKLEDLEQVQWEIEYPRKMMEMEQRLKDAEKELRRVEMLANNPELARKVLGAGSYTNAIRPETLTLARESFRLVKQQFQFLQSTNFAALGFDLTGQRTEWKRRELEFQRRRQQSRFEMPFNGRLTVSVPISEGVTNYPVNQGQELAVARDISAVRARVVIDNVAWTGLQPDKMRVVVTTGGRALEARFIFQKIEKMQNREESAYYFEFQKEKSAEAARLIGANNQCDLWVDLPESAHIVPKLAVILHQPDAFQSRHWGVGLSSTFPGARLVLEGQSDLAIVVPHSQPAKTPEVKLSSAK